MAGDCVRSFASPLTGIAGAYPTCSTAAVPYSYFIRLTSADPIPLAMTQTLLHAPPFRTHEAIYKMSGRPPSPSAHFYTNRGYPRTARQRTPEMDEPSDYPEPFGQYQGFSAHRDDKQPMYQFGLHEYQIPEEMISPRMPIPNPVLLRGLPLPRTSGLVRNNGGMVTPMHRHTVDQHSSSVVTQRPAITHCSLTHHNSLPPLYNGTYHHNPATGPPPPSRPFHCTPVRQDGHGYPSTHLNNNISGTIQVPSVSELSSTSSYDDHTIRPSEHRHNNGAGHTEGIYPLASGRADNSTLESIYPDNGTNPEVPHDADNHSPRRLTMSTGGFVSTIGEDLADDVVEVHDVCLLVTQRYLDALRVNWSLRHGREKTVPGRAAVIGQRAASGKILKKKKEQGSLGDDHRAARLSTSSHDRRRQRSGGSNGSRGALSEGSDLDGRETYRGSLDDGTGSQLCPCSSKHQRNGSRRGSHRSANNPIPRPTDSLLQNIHHICEVIWRRARRDRVDVLGAEAKCCRDMQVLQECGETIVLYNAVDFERDAAGCFGRVLEAGKGVCRELRDWEALRVMEGWDEEEGQEERV